MILRKNQDGTQISVKGLEAMGKSIALLRVVIIGRTHLESQENESHSS